MNVDQVALLPAYVAAGVAVLVLLADLVVPAAPDGPAGGSARRGVDRSGRPAVHGPASGPAASGPAASGRPGFVVAVASLGALGAAVTAIAVGVHGGARRAFCVDASACSLVTDRGSAVVAALFALLTLGVLALSVPLLRSGDVPAGEYCFLLACSMTGGVVLGSARDLISLIIALETLTLPLYILVGLRRRPSSLATGGSAAALTFFLVSVVSTTVALLGAALLYAATGAVHFATLTAALTGGLPAGAGPLATVGVVLLLTGLGFKVAAVPLHAWAPPTYDGAPLPVAAYLSTASKLGGVIALTFVTFGALRPVLSTAGPTLAGLAILTMTIGNLAALRQRRMVRLLAWSSIAQAGYILAPLGGLAAADRDAAPGLVTAAVAYTIFFVVIELSAFGALVAIRGTADGGEIVDYRGVARRSPWLAALLALSLAGLAGLPPGLAGMFAKIAVVRSLLDGGSAWLAVIVALNAVVGLAYYVRVATALFSPTEASYSPTGVLQPSIEALELPTETPVPVGAAIAGSARVDGAGSGVDGWGVDGLGVDGLSVDGLGVDGGGLGGVPAGAGAASGATRTLPGLVWAVGLALAVTTVVAVVVGFAPQVVLDVAAYVRP